MVCGNIFKTLSIPNRKTQGAEILRESLYHTMRHVSHVACFFCCCCFFCILKKLDKVVELVGGGYVINGAYPVQFLYKFPYFFTSVLVFSKLCRLGFIRKSFLSCLNFSATQSFSQSFTLSIKDLVKIYIYIYIYINSGLYFIRLCELSVKVLDIPQVYNQALVFNDNNQLITKH